MSVTQLATAPTQHLHRHRAQRMFLRTSALYRVAGDTTWHSGSTENVSLSGLLLRTQHRLPMGSTVTINVALPAELAGAPGTQVALEAVVVRGPEKDDGYLYGLAVRAYELRPASRRVSSRPNSGGGNPEHRLNNMLTVVLGQSEVLLADCDSLDADLVRRIEDIRDAAAKAAEIAQRMSSGGW